MQLAAVMDRLASNADIKAADHQIKINELIVRETAAAPLPYGPFQCGL